MMELTERLCTFNPELDSVKPGVQVLRIYELLDQQGPTSISFGKPQQSFQQGHYFLWTCLQLQRMQMNLQCSFSAALQV